MKPKALFFERRLCCAKLFAWRKIRMLTVRRKVFLKMVIAALSVPTSITIVLGLYAFMISPAFTGGEIPHQSDEELIANFQSHRAEFNQLLWMIAEDKELKRVDVYWTAPENPQAVGITAERIAQYRALFRRAGLARGFSAFRENRVEFIASAQGLAVSGSSKGYVFAGEHPPHVVDDLDKFRLLKNKPHSYPAYRHIEGNWYLFFEAD